MASQPVSDSYATSLKPSNVSRESTNYHLALITAAP
jgi:hypothetical protein